jgi:hypothetical protein
VETGSCFTTFSGRNHAVSFVRRLVVWGRKAWPH